MIAALAALNTRDIALYVWERCLFQPYRWGGDDPIHGYDCSGLVVEGLRAAGKMARDQDDVAAGLATRFPAATRIRRGVLLFWTWGGTSIVHTEVVWSITAGGIYTIGAAAGGSKTTSAEAAAAQNAYVMIRPARPNWAKAVEPFADITGD